jgi:hypothetical protein
MAGAIFRLIFRSGEGTLISVPLFHFEAKGTN